MVKECIATILKLKPPLEKLNWFWFFGFFLGFILVNQPTVHSERVSRGRVCGCGPGCWRWWEVRGERWHVTFAMWHMPCNMWHVTHDKWHFFLKLLFSFGIQQGFSPWQKISYEWKKYWEQQCALISHNMLSKTNTSIFIWKNHSTHFFWMEILGFCLFLNQIRLHKTIFWTNMEFFSSSIQYNIFSNLLKLLLTTSAFCLIQKSEMIAKVYFINVTKKLNIFQNKSFSVFKDAIFGIFDHT